VKQNVKVEIVVSFDDQHMQADVDEAVVDAIAGLKKMLVFLPAIKGKSGRGREVSFKIVDVQRP